MYVLYVCIFANTMKFSIKPDFFDLNKLECTLIAPRLALQKIFQAPRRGQLKITGNVVNVPAGISNTINTCYPVIQAACY